jgi:hypothetical protein
MAETEKRELRSSADELAGKALSDNSSPYKSSDDVYAFVCELLIQRLVINPSRWDALRTNWCPRSDSNRHWKDFKSSVSAIGLRGPQSTARKFT